MKVKLRQKANIILRPEVRRFAEAMELKLRKHDKDYCGWKNCQQSYLYERARQEFSEFVSEVRLCEKAVTGDYSLTSCLSEAADVANFLMMICDNYGLLNNEQT